MRKRWGARGITGRGSPKFFGSSDVARIPTNFLILESDASSFLLLETNSDKLLLESE